MSKKTSKTPAAAKSTSKKSTRKASKGVRTIAPAETRSGFLTVRQAAEKMGCTLATVQVRIRAGKLPGAIRSSTGWSWLIPTSAVSDFLAPKGEKAA